jgi:transposase-like protein
MAEAAVKCPHCQSETVVKYGKTSTGMERFRCQPRAACGRTFLRTYAYPGCLPTVKQQIVDMTRNGSGLRDIARVLHVGPNTVLREVKKSRQAFPGQPQRGGRQQFWVRGKTTEVKSRTHTDKR